MPFRNPAYGLHKEKIQKHFQQILIRKEWLGLRVAKELKSDSLNTAQSSILLEAHVGCLAFAESELFEPSIVEQLCARSRKEGATSETQTKFANTAKTSGCEVFTERPLIKIGKNALRKIDFIAESDNAIFYVEVDGPNHFLPDGVTPNPETVYRDELNCRLIEKAIAEQNFRSKKICYVTLPCTETNLLRTDEERAKYLAEKFAAAKVIHAPNTEEQAGWTTTTKPSLKHFGFTKAAQAAVGEKVEKLAEEKSEESENADEAAAAEPSTHQTSKKQKGRGKIPTQMGDPHAAKSQPSNKPKSQLVKTEPAMVQKWRAWARDASYNPNLQNHFGITGLHELVKMQNINLLERYVEIFQNAVCRPFDIDAPDEKGYAPLTYAVLHKNHYALKFLLNHGAEIDKTPNEALQEPLVTAFGMACAEGNYDAARALIWHGADVYKKAKNQYSYSPLELTVIKKHSQITDLLVEVMTQENAANSSGELTPLSEAELESMKKIIKKVMIFADSSDKQKEESFSALDRSLDNGGNFYTHLSQILLKTNRSSAVALLRKIQERQKAGESSDHPSASVSDSTTQQLNTAAGMAAGHS